MNCICFHNFTKTFSLQTKMSIQEATSKRNGYKLQNKFFYGNSRERGLREPLNVFVLSTTGSSSEKIGCNANKRSSRYCQ